MDGAEGADTGFAADESATNMSPVDETLFASAKVGSASGSDVSGTIDFRQREGVVTVEGRLTGLQPGEHGLHIHETGDCSAADASSAGGHFAPDDDIHGAPDDARQRHHVGDLGNIAAADDGAVTFTKTDAEMSLGSGENSVLDRAIVIHAQADDLGSQPAGDAGKRVGCGVIERTVESAF